MVVYRVLSIYRVLPGFREFAVFKKSKRFFYIFFGWVIHRGGQGPGKGPNIYIYIYIYMVVYRVLSIYRVLPGFREFAVFKKSKRFFYIFFGWVIHRGGQGPGKGPNIYISYKTARVVGLTPSLKSQGRGLRNPRKSTVCNYNTVRII